MIKATLGSLYHRVYSLVFFAKSINCNYSPYYITYEIQSCSSLDNINFYTPFKS